MRDTTLRDRSQPTQKPRRKQPSLKKGEDSKTNECGNTERKKQHGSTLSILKKDLFLSLQLCQLEPRELFSCTPYFTDGVEPVWYQPPFPIQDHVTGMHLSAGMFSQGPITTVSSNPYHHCRTHLCLKALRDIFRKSRLCHCPLEK